MKRNSTAKRVDGNRSEIASPKELVRLHESLFKGAPPMRENNGFLGFPPAFEFKKVSMWKDVPTTYSTDTHAGVGHA
jgi:hypothetical protein